MLYNNILVTSNHLPIVEKKSYSLKLLAINEFI